ncbi:hypothetical protein PFISCL1PPCAC_6410 [Pristionchus fissidentatus]|uniref:G protein-coupled receptor n=1 Tax=Pristionchus fissidentatus TaxID=1538716 RepID=A0AAV5VA38_9BILA|nr:hypothetical protein PFISCL1PPCAC_6410 [Pristionchus fissidentatus]
MGEAAIPLSQLARVEARSIKRAGVSSVSQSSCNFSLVGRVAKDGAAISSLLDSSRLFLTAIAAALAAESTVEKGRGRSITEPGQRFFLDFFPISPGVEIAPIARFQLLIMSLFFNSFLLVDLWIQYGHRNLRWIFVFLFIVAFIIIPSPSLLSTIFPRSSLRFLQSHLGSDAAV